MCFIQQGSRETQATEGDWRAGTVTGSRGYKDCVAFKQSQGILGEHPWGWS